MRNAARTAQRALRGVLLGCAVACMACTTGEETCDRDSLQARLDAATPGETVRLGACEVMGPIEVPAGVRLEGTEGSVLVGPEGMAAALLRAASTEQPVALHHVTIRAEGLIGVLARGAGPVHLEDVEVEVARGIGVGAAGVTAFEALDVRIRGPVSRETAGDPAYLQVIAAPPAAAPCPEGADCECTPGERDGDRACDASGRWAAVGPAHGLWLEGVGEARLEGVTLTGFAAFGGVFTDSDVAWRGGEVAENLGVGLRQVGGSLHLEDVVVRDTLQGLRGVPAYGVAATDSARVESTRLVLRDNDRYGLLALASQSVHTDLEAESNGDAALWVGGSDGFTLEGDATSLRDNAFAGVVVVDSRGVRIRDGRIEGTRAAERAVGTFGLRRIGDGLHLGGTVDDVRIEGVRFVGNARAGLVVDLGEEATADVTFADVTVDAEGASLGAVAGHIDATGQLEPLTLGGWDDGIRRLGDTVANDAALTESLDAVAEDRPSELPAPAEQLGVIAPMF